MQTLRRLQAKFKIWVNVQLVGYDTALRAVEEMMKRDEDFLVEHKVDGKWVKVSE